MKYTALLISIFYYSILTAQVDSTATEENSDSIVYIVKDPHYIRETIHLRAEPIKSIALELRSGYSVYHSYYDVCADCKGLFDSTQSSISTKKGYRAGAGISHFGKRFTQQLYIDYQEYQEKFSLSTFMTSTNTLEYLNIGFEYGVKFIRMKNFSSAFAASAEWQKNIGVSGSTYSEDKIYRIVKLSEEKSYRDLWVLGAAVRNYLNVGKRTGISLSALYRFETLPNTIKKEPFIEQKNTFYGMLGLLVYLN